MLLASEKTWKMYKYVDYILFQGRVYIYFGQEDGTISVQPQTIISCEVVLDLAIHFYIFISVQKRDRLHVWTAWYCRTSIVTMDGRFPVETWMETDSRICLLVHPLLPLVENNEDLSPFILHILLLTNGQTSAFWMQTGGMMVTWWVWYRKGPGKEVTVRGICGLRKLN